MAEDYYSFTPAILNKQSKKRERRRGRERERER